jgi:hypothetical protein
MIVGVRRWWDMVGRVVGGVLGSKQIVGGYSRVQQYRYGLGDRRGN